MRKLQYLAILGAGDLCVHIPLDNSHQHNTPENVFDVRYERLKAIPLLTLNATVVCLKSLYDSVDTDQTAPNPIGAVCSGSSLFASILHSEFHR